MRVLLTNDDGISATGLQAARRALRELDGVEVDVIAPDSNRSATARSITTRSPLTVEEFEFGDGDRGFATDGTPVDCVRFAELGLVGAPAGPDRLRDQPRRQPRRRHHLLGHRRRRLRGDRPRHSRRGDLPAVIQRRHGLRQRSLRFLGRGAFVAQLVGALVGEPMPPKTLINVNCPAGEPTGIEVTKLGKRVYNDELKLVSEDEDGRRHYEIYGWQPGFEELEGTDLMAVSQGRIAVTPIHFDLTDHGGLERLRGWRFEEMLAASSPAA